MKYLKITHLITGSLALLLVLVEGSVLATQIDTATYAVPLLTGGLLSLVLGTYLIPKPGFPGFIQILAFILLTSGIALSANELHELTIVQLPIATYPAILLLFSVGILLHPVSALRTTTSLETASAELARETGTVKWFNISKGFGFITRDQGDDVFVHYRSIRGEGHRTLNEGQRVEFSVIENDKGLQAEDVTSIY